MAASRSLSNSAGMALFSAVLLISAAVATLTAALLACAWLG